MAGRGAPSMACHAGAGMGEAPFSLEGRDRGIGQRTMAISLVIHQQLLEPPARSTALSGSRALSQASLLARALVAPTTIPRHHLVCVVVIVGTHLPPPFSSREGGAWLWAASNFNSLHTIAS